ncbi:MAG: toxin-antitoxin system HicB family antitoxin [Anaerolineae bacterium]|nr:MAG: toxin-antitoxin system HicB family antitoxin [Anaerolineae bacterium]
MTTLSVRLPDSLHRKVKDLAQQDGISINQFVTVAVAEKLSALLTEEYLQERARRGAAVATRPPWPRRRTWP